MWYFIHLFVLCGILLCFTIIFCSIFHYSSLSCRTDKKVIERSQKNACLAHETLVQPLCLEFQYFISKIVRLKLTLLNGSNKKTFLKQSTVTGTQSMVAPRYLKNNCVLVYKCGFFKTSPSCFSTLQPRPFHLQILLCYLAHSRCSMCGSEIEFLRVVIDFK